MLRWKEKRGKSHLIGRAVVFLSYINVLANCNRGAGCCKVTAQIGWPGVGAHFSNARISTERTELLASVNWSRSCINGSSFNFKQNAASRLTFISVLKPLESILWWKASTAKKKKKNCSGQGGKILKYD